MVLAFLGLVGCNAQTQKIEDRISVIEENVFWGMTENFFVEVVEGKKEKNFVADGKNIEVTNCFELRVTPIVQGIEKINVSFLNGTEPKTFELKEKAQQNYFDFVAFEVIEMPSEVVIEANSKIETAKMQNILQDKISAQKSIEIAKKLHQERLKEKGENFDESKYEIVCKIARDRNGIGGNFFWYVSMIGENSMWSALINCENGSLVAEKKFENGKL